MAAAIADSRLAGAPVLGGGSGGPILYHPSFAGLVRAEAAVVSDDPNEQVAQVIGLMRAYTMEDVRSPRTQLRLQAVEAAGGARSVPELLSNIHRYVHSRIVFLSDEATALPLGAVYRDPQLPIVETLVRPNELAEMCIDGSCRPSGDCDDFSMYTAALLALNGVRSAFVTVAANSDDPSRFSHVYVVAYPPDGTRVAMDASHGAYAGWEVSGAGVYRREEWPLESAPLVGLIVLGSVGYALWSMAGSS